MPPFFALVRGHRDGRPITVGVELLEFPPTMALATGIPLAIGVRQLLDGTIYTPGAHPPEAVVDPSGFFDVMAQNCVPSRTAGSDIISVVEQAD